jgi:hypothetical protein
MTTATQSKLGIFEQPAAEYHAHPAISKGKLATFMNRRRLFQAEFIEGRKPERKTTTEMDIGTLTHLGVLEPERFADAYAVYPADVLGKNGAASTNAAKAWCEAQESAGKIVLKQESLDAVLAMVASVKTTFAPWLALESKREQSVYWQDPETGLHCRCRPDWLILNNGTAFIFDLKTTSDSSHDGFRRAAEQFSYWLQHAHYSAGVQQALDFEFDPEFYFVVVETQFPHATAIYRMPDPIAERSDLIRRGLLRDMAACFNGGDWSEPWEGVIQPLNLRPWCFPDER